MLSIKISPSRLPWLLAAAFAVTAVTPHSAWALANASTTKLLSSQLPRGTTLARATVDEVVAATRSAVSQRPDLAVSIVQVAIESKTPKPGQGTISCRNVMKIVRAGTNAAPDKGREILEMAMSLHPECAGELDDLLKHPGLTNTGEPEAAAGAGDLGFGAGFGSGFPGSPGFIGSAPGGTTALPPAVQPLSPT